ncbi:MAG: glycosyltransferase [Gemmatimonadales bacterium]|nr:glycosyltransferase [Gemmatimonadales bacterium]
MILCPPMRIALLYHGRLPVERYGGTERVVVWLARGLAELGHEVTLLAGPGSRVPEARLVPVDPFQAEHVDFDPRPFLPPGIDVLHAHRPIAVPGVPTLWTLHGTANRADYPPNMVCLSADHMKRSGGAAFVHNGLDPAEYRFSALKQDFDLFLGRLHSAKGWQWAVEGARRSGKKLIVAGGWRPVFRRGVRVVGTVGGERKRDLLAGAACLWMPARWDEPFGLTTIEAMVSGTPVLGTRRGALPEIVTTESGALGDTLDELIAARPSIAGIDPEGCRARVLERFTHRVMAERYLELYRQVIETGSLSSP